MKIARTIIVLVIVWVLVITGITVQSKMNNQKLPIVPHNILMNKIDIIPIPTVITHIKRSGDIHLSTGLSSYITQQQAYQYAASAGFTTAIVPGTNLTQLQLITAIAGAESNYDTQAINSKDPYGGSYGLLQINGVHFGSGKGMSANGALDPRTAFKYAYSISGGGMNFTPWVGYTSGKYKKYVPSDPATSAPKKLASNGWWNFPRVDNYGSPDPYGGFPKPDSNILVPDNYPILNLLPGTITGIGSPSGQTPAWGQVITLKLDKPLNGLATHEAYLHLAGLAPGLKIGMHVDSGSLIGYNGGNNAAGSQKVPLGFALTPVDYYGYGSQWVNTVGNPQLNPVSLLDAAKTGNLSSGTLSSVVTFNTGTPTFDPSKILGSIQQVNVGPNSDVLAILLLLDQVMTIYNPFPPIDPKLAVIQDPSLVVNILGIGIINPFQYWIDLMLNLFQDFAAIVMRAFIFFLGAFMIFKVIDKLTGIVSTIGKVTEVGLAVAARA
jgi:hypothetical protein